MADVTLYGPDALFAGLWLTGAKEALPRGYLRRAKGVHHLRTTSLRSRWGSTKLFDLTAHSLYRFNDVRFQGVGTVLHRDGSSILTGLDGNRLAFVAMPPTTETEVDETALADSLFVAGGGLMRKVDTAGAVTNWGIVKPPDGFTATKAAQLSKVIDVLDIASSWTGSSATLADEATILQEGVNSMKVTVAKNAVGKADKSISINLETFGATEPSPDEDYIFLWARVDNPANLKDLQIVFDVGSGDFATDFYTVTIPVSGTAPPTPGQVVSQVEGVASRPNFTGKERDFIADAVAALIPPAETVRILNELGQANLVTNQDTWIKLRLPKASFLRTGSGAGTWANVAAVRLIVNTTAKGSVIVYLDDLEMIGGGGGLLGNYKHLVTFRNSVTGSRSNANPTPAETNNVDRQSINLANLPISTDAQVDQREIWRTLGNGTLFFRIKVIEDNTTLTFTDNVSDYFGLDSSFGALVMENLELPLDNIPPESTYDDAFGPWQGRMWWTRDSATGAKGRVYFSPNGRAESVESFIIVSSDDEPTQKGIVWNGNAYVFTEARIYQIVGTTTPFFSREIFGVPGTTNLHTIKATPFGIIYQAADGVRVFNGATSKLIAFESVSVIFNGESASDIAAFEGVVAAYGDDEYFISDTNTTLALDLRLNGWREVGPAATALFFEEDTKLLIASFSSKVLILEDENVLTDDGAAIPFDVETKGKLIDVSQRGIVRYIFIEANTDSQQLIPELIIDEVTITLPGLQTTKRSTTEYRIEQEGKVISVRLTGNVSKQVEITRIEADVYAPARAKDSRLGDVNESKRPATDLI